MRILIDTHTFIWFVLNQPQLSNRVRNLISEPDKIRMFSIASVWEMAIKHSQGKLSFTLPFDIFINQQLTINKLRVIDINLDHIAVVASLPFHHRDPFDRLIIAQAIVERIPILSRDSAFDDYPIERWW